ncbi:putative reverse transcriptase domain-containing protein [Tanacetum coccineum]
MVKLSSLDDTTVLGSFPPLSTSVTTTTGNAPGKSSYANVTGKPSGKKLNIRTLFTPGGNGIDVVVPVESIRAISDHFANTTYGFFLGKQVAYPVVANYVRNTWGKYGLVHSMFSVSTRLFSFQFSSIDGLDAMLENGSWFIQNNPLILKKWHPDEKLLKEDVSTIPVWVKLHGVPVTAFSDDGLSAIATKLGKDGASVGENRGVKGCTIISIISDFGVTAGEVCRTKKIVRRTWCLIKWHLLRCEVRRTKRILRRTLALFINSSLDSLLDSSYNDR